MNDEFSLDDVKELMYQTLLKKEHSEEELQISRIGEIIGFVDLNGELEVIVKFFDRIEQYNKTALSEQVDLIKEELDDDE